MPFDDWLFLIRRDERHPFKLNRDDTTRRKGRVLLDGPIQQVRATGGNTVQLDYEGDGTFVKSVRGVTRVNDAGKHAEFVLAPGNDPDEILKQLVGKVKVRRFDTREASLHEIFVRSVGGDITERGASHA